MSSSKTITASIFLFIFQSFFYTIIASGITLALVNGREHGIFSPFGSLLMIFAFINFGVQVISGPIADYFGPKKLSCISSIFFLMRSNASEL